MSSPTITDRYARDKRLAARYMAGTSLREIARLERCSELTMRNRLLAAGAILRRSTRYQDPPTERTIEDPLVVANRAFVAKLKAYAAKHHPGVKL